MTGQQERARPFMVYAASDTALDLLGPTLASLPITVHGSRDQDDSVHVVDGRAVHWPELVVTAARQGARGVLVLGPWLPDRGMDDALLVSAGLPVVLDLAWAGNPALSGVALSEPDSTRVVIAHGSSSDDRHDGLAAAAVDLVVSVSRLMTRRPTQLRFEESLSSVSVSGRWDATVLRLSVVRSTAVQSTATISAYGERWAWDASLPDPVTAAPAVVTATDLGGIQSAPTIYETSRRASLRRVSDLARRGETSSDLMEYQSVLIAFGRDHEAEIA